MHTPLMACLNEQLHVRIHERNGHGDSGSVWKNEIRILAELLYDAKDVIPSTTI